MEPIEDLHHLRLKLSESAWTNETPEPVEVYTDLIFQKNNGAKNNRTLGSGVLRRGGKKVTSPKKCRQMVKVVFTNFNTHFPIFVVLLTVGLPRLMD